jgi:hypothetical protein
LAEAQDTALMESTAWLVVVFQVADVPRSGLVEVTTSSCSSTARHSAAWKQVIAPPERREPAAFTGVPHDGVALNGLAEWTIAPWPSSEKQLVVASHVSEET